MGSLRSLRSASVEEQRSDVSRDIQALRDDIRESCERVRALYESEFKVKFRIDDIDVEALRRLAVTIERKSQS